MLGENLSVQVAEEEEEDDVPWELLDEDNWLQIQDDYIENAELVELKLAEGALDHVAGAICHKVSYLFDATTFLKNKLE